MKDDRRRGIATRDVIVLTLVKKSMKIYLYPGISTPSLLQVQTNERIIVQTNQGIIGERAHEEG